MSKRTVIIAASVLIAACAAVVWFVVHISHPRVVARAVTPDGTELCIVQECNWSPELFTTSFVYRKPGLAWRWFYYDHQDSYWGTGKVTIDTNTHVAVFYRRSSPAVTFRWDREIYTLHRRNETVTNAQYQMTSAWTPQMPVYSGR